MHAQIVTFNLKDMTTEELQKAGEDVFLPALLEMPGLLGKIWLQDPANNSYGGVYTWREKQDMLNYLKSDLFVGFSGSPNIVNVKSQDFEIVEAPTRAMNGLPTETVRR